MHRILFFIFLLGSFTTVHAQAGISVSPGKLYYKVSPGGKNTQYIQVSNPTNSELEVGVSFSDWDYGKTGNNQIKEAGVLENSNTDWIQVLPDTYFLLKPKETRQLEVAFNVPEDADTDIPVHTGMIFLTQLNPGNAKDESGAAIQVSVRMGVKVYHSFEQQSSSEIEVVNLRNYTDEDSGAKMVELELENQGRIWTNGNVSWELFNNSTGEKQVIGESDFYTLPDDLRAINQKLPEDIEAGEYTLSAVVTYGESDTINIAELDFSI